MEMLGILFAIPFGFCASLAYSYFADVVLSVQQSIRQWLLKASWLVLLLFVIELTAVYIWGVLGARKVFGYIFVIVHGIVFFLSTPALANVFLLSRGYRFRPRWYLVALPCFLLAMFDLFYNIHISETLYGIDGMGGPYSTK